MPDFGPGGVAAGGALWRRDQQPGPRRASPIPCLLSMDTEPEFRRKGLATKVVRAAIAWARRRGYPKVLLRASRMGRGVYGRLGWERAWEMEVRLS